MRFPGSDNPVYLMTLRQLQARPRRHGWRWWVSSGLYVVMLALALIVFFGHWAGLLLWRNPYPIVRALETLLVFLTFYAIFTHIGILFRTLLTAASLISSTRTSASWDLLVLTGLPARQIVSGLWWAVMRAALPDWLRLLPLRVGATVYIGASFSYPMIGLYSYSLGMTTGSRTPDLVLVPPSPLGLLLIVPLSLGFSLLAGALAAAIGLLASSLVKRASLALAIAFALLIGLLGTGLLVAALAHRVSWTLFPPDNFALTPAYADFTTINNAVALSWFDNGGSLLSSLVVYSAMPAPVDSGALWALVRNRNGQIYSGWSVALIPVIVAGLAWLLRRVLLAVARRAVVRAGALPVS